MYIFNKQIVGSNLFAKTNLWFTIGFILTVALTFSEVARGRHKGGKTKRVNMWSA